MTTPAVTFCYDGLPTSGACATSGTTGFLGRLTYVANNQSSTTYNLFDVMGRITTSTQSTGGAAYPFSYTYWLNGALASVTYPSGRQMAYTLDTAGRVSSVTGTLSGTQTNYVTGVQYKPWNAIQQLSMHNGLTETWTYNARMQPLAVAASKGSSTLLTLDTWYCTGPSPAQDCATNNGNVLQAWVGPSATPAYQQTFSYDSLNRLTSATEGAPWAQTYGYDIFGNRWATGTGPGLDSTTPAASTWYSSTPNTSTTNRYINGGTYDQYGVGNFASIGNYAFSYDGENRMVRSTLNGIDTNYAYDGDGRRVQKTGSNSTTFVYDARGALAAEYSTQAPPVAGTEYVTVDHLGSTRLTTDASGNPISYHDYVPFGTEIPAGVNGRSNLYGAADGMNKKFTGQYRDTETQSSAMTSGLDYFGARYFSAAQGRFTIPDWSAVLEPVPYADLSDPQTLNLYAYVRNNPLNRSDIDGHGPITCKTNPGLCAAIRDSVSSGGSIEDGQTAYSQAHVKKQGAPTLKGSTPEHHWDGDFLKDRKGNIVPGVSPPGLGDLITQAAVAVGEASAAGKVVEWGAAALEGTGIAGLARMGSALKKGKRQSIPSIQGSDLVMNWEDERRSSGCSAAAAKPRGGCGVGSGV